MKYVLVNEDGEYFSRYFRGMGVFVENKDEVVMRFDSKEQAMDWAPNDEMTVKKV